MNMKRREFILTLGGADVERVVKAASGDSLDGRAWGRQRFDRRLRLSWRNGRADRARRFARGRVGSRGRGLRLGLIPWTVVDDQHCEHAECRDRKRDHERRAATTLGTPLG
jgi:hypothetical protein